MKYSVPIRLQSHRSVLKVRKAGKRLLVYLITYRTNDELRELFDGFKFVPSPADRAPLVIASMYRVSELCERIDVVGVLDAACGPAPDGWSQEWSNR